MKNQVSRFGASCSWYLFCIFNFILSCFDAGARDVNGRIQVSWTKSMGLNLSVCACINGWMVLESIEMQLMGFGPHLGIHSWLWKDIHKSQHLNYYRHLFKIFSILDKNATLLIYFNLKSKIIIKLHFTYQERVLCNQNFRILKVNAVLIQESILPFGIFFMLSTISFLMETIGCKGIFGQNVKFWTQVNGNTSVGSLLTWFVHY